MSVNSIKCGKKEARLTLVKNFCLSDRIKQKYAPDAPAIYGIKPVEESDGLKVWETEPTSVIFLY